ncbi:hypothetical protein LTR17_024939 [Elasticomyces elasticus]|nr:hypothetical protein LTR17_024939 [Elasticomyces elasticus]
MAGVQHDQGKRKADEEHPFERESHKRWSESNSHGREHPAGPGGTQTIGMLSAALRLTPREMPLYLQPANSSSPYPDARPSHQQAFAGGHCNPDGAPDAQELADASQYEHPAQTGEPYYVDTAQPSLVAEPGLSRSCVPVPDLDGIMKYYCVEPACFEELPPFASVEEYRQHELVHVPSTAMQPPNQNTLRIATSVVASTSQATASLPDVSASKVLTVSARATPSSSQSGLGSLATSPVDSNELKLLDLVAGYPVQQTVKIVNGGQVWTYRCGVAGCKTKGTFKSEKLAQ